MLIFEKQNNFLDLIEEKKLKRKREKKFLFSRKNLFFC